MPSPGGCGKIGVRQLRVLPAGAGTDIGCFDPNAVLPGYQDNFLGRTRTAKGSHQLIISLSQVR